MMDGITPIFGIGVVLIILSYIAFNLNDKHKYLKVFIISLVFFGLIGVPKYMMDNADYCEIVVSSANSSIENYVTYGYERVCYENLADSSEITFTIIIWAASMFILWMVVYMLWDTFEGQIKNIFGKFRRGKT